MQSLIDPEWYGVAKAVCYMIGAGCCMACFMLGYALGRRSSRSSSIS